MRLRLSLIFTLSAIAALAAAGHAPGDERPVAEAQAATTPAPRSILAGGAWGPLIGLSDNRYETMLDKRFQASGIRRIRVLVPFDDVARGGERRRSLDSFLQTARDKKIEPLVSFYRTYRCDVPCAKRYLPSVAQYRYHFRRFRARYPWVRNFATWNEANFPDAQPTGKNPRRAAEFYKVARKECPGGRCRVLTADFRADGSAHSARWLETFKRHIGRGPHIWGLVSHPDINRFSTARTRWFLAHTRGPVWATEVGAVNFFGKGFRPNLKRQKKAMHFLMTRYPSVSRRLQRMYVYHWRAARGNRLWDSALLSTSGKRRPAYYVFFRALGLKAP